MAKKLIGKPDNKAEKTARFWYVWRTFWYINQIATMIAAVSMFWGVGYFILLAATHYSASVMCLSFTNALDCLNLVSDMNRLFMIASLFLAIGLVAWVFTKIKGKSAYYV